MRSVIQVASSQLAGELDPYRSLQAFDDVPSTDDELWDWVDKYLNVQIPRKSCCPEHAPPFRAFADSYFRRAPITVWLASRGFGGKSFLLALLTLTEAITLGASVNLLGGSGEQAQRVHAYLSGEDPNAWGRFWNSPHAPTGLLRTDPTKREMSLTNGGHVKALMASQTSVRGPHPQRLRLDEVDEMDIKVFDAAMGQTMPARGISAQTVCSSTHHNPDGTFTEILKRASEKDWPVYEWCYRENLETHGWLTQAAVDQKKIEVPEAMWQIEYELQEPSPEARAIDAEAVRSLFDRKLGEFHGRPDKEIRLVEPFHLRSFYHGTDWARSADWTIIHSMELVENGPDRLAAWTRTGRKPWPLMIGAANVRMGEYGGPAAHDSTGVGDVCNDYLEHDSLAFDFRAAKERAEMLSNYIAAIERGDELAYPMIEYAYHEHLYATMDDIYRPSGISSAHLPDTISAAALALYAKEYGPQPYDISEWGTLRK